jgi:predicted N-acetyltransferase YhbS
MIEIKYLSECQHYIPYLAKLQFEEISRHWVPNATILSTKQKLIQHANRDTLPMTLVATKNHEPIGMASLRINDGIRSDLEPWLGSLVVDKKHRGCKIGERLIKAIKQEAKSRGYPEIYLLAFDKTIPTWYAELGWGKIGDDELFGHPITVMCHPL